MEGGGECLNSLVRRKHPFKKFYVLVNDRFTNTIFANVFIIVTYFQNFLRRQNHRQPNANLSEIIRELIEKLLCSAILDISSIIWDNGLKSEI